MKRKYFILALLLLFAACLSTLLACESEHIHKYSSSYSYDEQNHWRACYCGERNLESHTLQEEVVFAPSDLQVGVKRVYCECGYSQYQSIPALGHEQHSFEGEYLFDNVSHWKTCVCGEIKKEAHSLGQWVEIIPATEFAEGLRQAVCEVCGNTIQEKTSKLEHSHAYTGEYSFDNDNHWLTCSCGKTFAEIHTATQWTIVTPATETATGLQETVCAVCNNKYTQIIPCVKHVHAFNETEKFDNQYHWLACACGETTKAKHQFGEWAVITPATTSSQGEKKAICSCGYTKTAKIPTIIENAQVNLYAINDFHGKVERIAQTANYLKGLKQNNANTVLINSGDMFQGSLASNYNYGNLLSDCMDEIGFDSFTYGNHEFDWGLDAMRELSANSTTPFLGANIYNWNAQTREWGDFASDLAKEYVTVTLPNGVKVGIIGVIGKDQITSISSNLVQTIGFKDPKEIIPPLAEKLRDEEGCHVVVVSLHAPQSVLVGSDVENYVDAVFCAHTHQTEDTLSNGVPYVQGGSYGSNISYIKLTIKNGTVGTSDYGVISYKSSWQSDAAVANIVAEYAKETDALAQTQLATVNGTLGKTNSMPTLVCCAIAEYAMDCGYEVDIAICNQTRSDIYSGTITYEKLYQAIPFDNIIYVAEVTGSELIKVGRDNYVWRVNGEAFKPNEIYKVAVIDYVLFHQNNYREYDKLPSAFKNGRQPIALAKNGVSFYNYREITRDFLTKVQTIDVSEYELSNPRGARDQLGNNVTFNDDYYTSSAQAVWALLPSELVADKYRFAA